MPRRNVRWCCEVIKERPGTGLPILTGIRWAESSRRKKRAMVESCDRVKAFLVHPIIDWKTSDVWDYIRERGLNYCKLYDEGFHRIGCVLCPMTRDVERQMSRWPNIVRIWRRINDVTYDKGGHKCFASADAQWAWWLNRDASSREEDCPLFDGVLE